MCWWVKFSGCQVVVSCVLVGCVGEAVEVLAEWGGQGGVVEQVGQGGIQESVVDAGEEDRDAESGVGDLVAVAAGDGFDESVQA